MPLFDPTSRAGSIMSGAGSAATLPWRAAAGAASYIPDFWNFWMMPNNSGEADPESAEMQNRILAEILAQNQKRRGSAMSQPTNETFPITEDIGTRDRLAPMTRGEAAKKRGAPMSKPKEGGPLNEIIHRLNPGAMAKPTNEHLVTDEETAQAAAAVAGGAGGGGGRFTMPYQDGAPNTRGSQGVRRGAGLQASPGATPEILAGMQRFGAAYPQIVSNAMREAEMRKLLLMQRRGLISPQQRALSGLQAMSGADQKFRDSAPGQAWAQQQQRQNTNALDEILYAMMGGIS